MDNSTGQAHPQMPFSQYSPQPGGHSGYPTLQNGTPSSSPAFSAPTVQPASTPQQSHQIANNMRPSPNDISGYSPVYHYPNNGTPVNYQWPSHGGYGVPVQQAHGVNGMAGPQMYNHSVNGGNGFPQDYPVNGGNAGGFPQYVQTHPAAGAHPGLHRNVLPFPPRPGQTTSQSTPSTANTSPVIRSSRQNIGRGGQPPVQGYRKIIDESLLPQKKRRMPYQTGSSYQEVPSQVFNDGTYPLCMPPDSLYAPRQITSAQQVPQPQDQTRYDLPQFATMPPRNDGTPNRPAAADGSGAQSGNVHNDANVPGPSTQPPATPTSARGVPPPRPRTMYDLPPLSPRPSPNNGTPNNGTPNRPAALDGSGAEGDNVQHDANVPVPSTNAPDTPTSRKRAAGEPLPQEPAKRQRPVANHSARQSPQSVANASQAIPNLDPCIPKKRRCPLCPGGLNPEPEHLPEDELRKIQTRAVIEPGEGHSKEASPREEESQPREESPPLYYSYVISDR